MCGIALRLLFGNLYSLYMIHIALYNKLGDLKMSVWNRRKEILYANKLVGEANGTSSSLECEVQNASTECFGG